MFNSLTTKYALHKAGLSSVKMPTFTTSSASKDPNAPRTEAEENAIAIPAFLTSNPFANASLPASWATWTTPIPAPIPVGTSPAIGTKAPSGGKLKLPCADGRPVVVSFLRFCGCPFAEKQFLELRRLANKYPTLHFIAISHASPAITQTWVNALGGAWSVEVIVDETRELHAMWGLGVSKTWHVLNPWTVAAARKLGNEEGIWVRDVSGRREYARENKAGNKPVPGADAKEVGSGSGSRWQIAGSWAVDGRGLVRWGGASASADDRGDLEEGIRMLR